MLDCNFNTYACMSLQKNDVHHLFLRIEYLIIIDSMDNYEILLEQFLVHEQQQASTHEQFTSIIDEIRNQKQAKKILLLRKKQEKNKLLNKVVKTQQQRISANKKNSQTFQMCEQELNLEQINNAMLKKQCDELQKQFNKLHKSVKQMQEQVSVYSRKDNQIKQLKYSSKRQLQTVLLQVKAQKTLNIQLEQKHEKVLEQLQDQKQIMQEQNRYFANQLQDLKIFHRNLSKNGSTLIGFQFGESNEKFVEIEEIYTKKKVEEYLRYFYFIVKLKENWFKSDLCLSIQEVRNQVQENLEVGEHFHFLSKNQIFAYYLQKLGQKSFISMVMVVLQLYRSITKNISNLENYNNHLNNKIVELKQQYEVLCEALEKAQLERLKSTTFMISECQKGIANQKQNIKKSSTSIFKFLEQFFEICDKIKRLINTVQFISQSKCQMSITQINSKPSLLHKTSKRMEHSPIDKRISGNITSSRNLNMMEGQSLLKSYTNLNLKPKKSVYHSQPNNKLDTSKYDEKLAEYELILKRNPRQIICRWNEVIKTQQGFRFIQNILQNDLFRVFLDPQDYNPQIPKLQNQKKCTNKIYESVRLLLKCLKQSFGLRLTNILTVNKQLENTVHKETNELTDTTGEESRFVIQSKGYFRRDNFKLLEKMEIMEMKKKGLYLPFRYGVDVENQMITNRTVIKEPKIQALDRSRMLTARKFRYTSPLNPNYISSYRQRLNKADRKIRDLLKNVDNLRVQNKLSNQQGRSSRKLSTRIGQTSVLLS